LELSKQNVVQAAFRYSVLKIYDIRNVQIFSTDSEYRNVAADVIAEMNVKCFAKSHEITNVTRSFSISDRNEVSSTIQFHVKNETFLQLRATWSPGYLNVRKYRSYHLFRSLLF